MMSPALEALAAAVHAVWCCQMVEEGWRRGDRYEETTRTHDALVPFPELHPLDRRHAINVAERLLVQVLREVDYPRGDDREFTADEVRRGQLVTLSQGGTFAGSSEEYTGRIVSWIVEPDSVLLRSITVQWSHGQETEHIPSMRELRRL